MQSAIPRGAAKSARAPGGGSIPDHQVELSRRRRDAAAQAGDHYGGTFWLGSRTPSRWRRTGGAQPTGMILRRTDPETPRSGQGEVSEPGQEIARLTR